MKPSIQKSSCLCVLLVLALLCTGCSNNTPAVPVPETSAPAETAEQTVQKLKFSVVPSEDSGKIIREEELGGKLGTSLVYGQLSEVKIVWAGETISPEDAIREEKLSGPELFAFARLDARNGFCTESYQSVNGLTHFLYTYPECVLRLAYDVYETPDGKQHLIEDIAIYPPDESGTRNYGENYVDEESPWGYFLDREDWGVSFTVAGATPTGLLLNYTKEQGQEFGTLNVTGYTLYRKEAQAVTALVRENWEYTQPDKIIPLDGDGQVRIDWEETAGTLEAGEYELRVTVTDIYDAESVHPLARNYYDRQSYTMEFTIS